MSTTGRGLVHEAHSKTEEWYTPPYIFAGLPVTFDLDPCSPDPNDPATTYLTPCRRHLCKRDDGLRAPWSGCVWLNPPYGAGLAAWIGKLARHGDGMALVFARTDTAWFHDHPPDAVFFLRGRVSFINAQTGTIMVKDPTTGREKRGSPGAPSMLLAYGERCVGALEATTLRGTLVYTCRASQNVRQTALFERQAA